MGLWHGASWNFAIWGVHHAFFIYIYRKINIIENLSVRIPALGWIFTTLISMSSWIPFRSQNLENTFSMYSIILNPFRYDLYLQKTPAKHYYIAFILLISMLAYYYIYKYEIKNLDNWNFTIFKLIKYSIIIFLIIVYLKPINQFIYFQF